MSPRTRRTVLRDAGGALAGAWLVGGSVGTSRVGAAGASRDRGHAGDALAVQPPVGTAGTSSVGAPATSRDGPDGAGTPTGTTTGTDRATPRVAFEPQTADAAGLRVTVDRAVVPAGGFVTVHDGGPTGSVVGVSDYLPPGDHRDVVVRIDEDSRVTRATGLTAMLVRDADGDETFDFLSGFGDRLYLVDGEPVHDGAVVFSPTPVPTDAPAVPSTRTATDAPSPAATSEGSPTAAATADGSVPGFGVVAAVVAVAAGAGAVTAWRRG